MDRLRADFAWSQQESAVPITGPVSLSVTLNLWKQNSSEGSNVLQKISFLLKV